MALLWEKLDSAISRARIPGGWLVSCDGSDVDSITFVPDPYHKWDGNSLDDDQD